MYTFTKVQKCPTWLNHILSWAYFKALFTPGFQWSDQKWSAEMHYNFHKLLTCISNASSMTTFVWISSGHSPLVLSLCITFSGVWLANTTKWMIPCCPAYEWTGKEANEKECSCNFDHNPCFLVQCSNAWIACFDALSLNTYDCCPWSGTHSGWIAFTLHMHCGHLHFGLYSYMVT